MRADNQAQVFNLKLINNLIKKFTLDYPR